MTRKEWEMWNIRMQGLIHLGVIIVVDVLFHFMYILTIPTDVRLMKRLSDWALGLCISLQIFRLLLNVALLNQLKWQQRDVTHVTALLPVGLAYFNLVYDWVKAAVLFGVVNTVSRLDHLDPPKPPKCITMLYVFAETWVAINSWLTFIVYTRRK